MTEWVFVANCGIYKLGSEKEKPAAKWSTEVAYTDGDDRDLKRFCNKLRNEAGLDKRCGQLDIQQYEVELSTRTFDATPGYPTGRCLSVDSNKGGGFRGLRFCGFGLFFVRFCGFYRNFVRFCGF